MRLSIFSCLILTVTLCFSSLANLKEERCQDYGHGFWTVVKKFSDQRYEIYSRAGQYDRYEHTSVLVTKAHNFLSEGYIEGELWVEASGRMAKGGNGFDIPLVEVSEECAYSQLSQDKTNGLVRAAKNGYLETAKRLVNEGWDLRVESSDGYSLLEIAERYKWPKIVEYLKAKGVKEGSRKKWHEFVKALSKKDLATAKKILNSGMSVNGLYDDTPLVYAAVRFGDLETVQKMLEKGADVNSKDPMGVSILMVAVHEHKKDIVKMLLAKGADPNVEGAGRTARSIAQEKGYKDLLSLLNQAKPAIK